MVFRISVEFHVSDVSGHNFLSIALSNIEYLVDSIHVQTRGFQMYEGMIYNHYVFLAKLAIPSYAFTMPMPSTARISEYELNIARRYLFSITRRYLGSAGSGGWLTPSYYLRSWWFGKSRSATEVRAGVLMWVRQETYYDEDLAAIEMTLPATLMF